MNARVATIIQDINVYLWPRLLIWINFNINMDK